MRNKTDCVDRFLLKDHTNYGYTGSRSIYFEDEVLYSYGEHWPLCIEHNQLVTITEQGQPNWEKMYFVNANNYSSSTAQQKWCLIRRLEALNKRYVLIRNPKDNKLMINLHKWIKSKLWLDLDLTNSRKEMDFAVIKNSLEQHLLDQLIKSIRAKKNKINEKQLITKTKRMIKHIENIGLDWQDKRLTYEGNQVLFTDHLINHPYMGVNSDKQTVMKDLIKKFLVSIRTRSSKSVHMINLKYYNQMVQKYQLDMKDIEQQLLVDKLAEA